MVGRNLTAKRILLVEDDDLIRDDMVETLRAFGALVTYAASVTEAMDLAELAFDHAFLDVRLTDGDVHPVALRLRERGVPITFCSALSRCGPLSSTYPGASVLVKPALPHQLLIAADGGAA